MSGGKAMEVFPDLHHKMSKKIAQLTKVIYHLNTKNEDHQAELESLASSNQMEIQNILRDAATKLSKFKEMVDSKQSSANVEAQVEKLQRKHDLEKQTALAELEMYKQKAKAREEKISSEFQNKFESTQEKVEKMNTKFRERIEAFEKMSAQYQIDIQNARASGSEGMEELRRKYEKEMEDYVQTSNAKYDAMLVEQLELQEKIKLDMETQLTMVKVQSEAKLKEELEKAVGMLRAKLGGEKEEAILALKRDYEAKIAKLREESSASLEKALEEVKKRGDEMNRLREEKDGVIKELQKKIADLNESLTSSLNDTDARCKQLMDSVDKANAEVASLKGDVEEKEKEIERLNALVAQTQEQYFDLSSQMNMLEAEVLRLTNLLADSNASKESTEGEMKAKLQAAQAEISALKQKLADSTTAANKLNEELATAKKDAKTASDKAEATIAKLTKENEKLQQQLRDAASMSSKALDGVNGEIAALKKKLADKDASFATEKAEIAAANQKSTTAMMDKHRTEVINFENAAREAADAAKKKEAAWNVSMEDMKKEFATQKELVEKVHMGAMEALKKSHEEAVAKLKATILGLENQIKELSSASDAEKGTLKGEMKALDSKVKSLQADIEKRKKESEKSESVCQSLKNQVEALREELKQVQLSHVEKLAQAKAKLDAEWKAKMQALEEAHKKALGESADESAKSFRAQMEAMKTDYEEQILTLKQALQKEASDARESNLSAEQDRLALEQALALEKKEHAADVAAVENKYVTDMADLTAKYKKDLEALRKELTEASEMALNSATAKLVGEMNALEQTLNASQAELKAKMEEESKSKIAAMEAAHRKQLAELQAKCAKDKADSVEAVKKSAADEKAALISKQESERTSWNADREVIQGNLADAQKENIRLGQEIDNRDALAKKREEEVRFEMDQLKREYDTLLRKEKESCERRILENDARNKEEIKALKQEFRADCARFEERMKEAKTEYEKLLHRYHNRESRPEDVARIKELELEMVEKDRLVQQTKDEMNYFKREMLNREEGYNNKFNASPTVGVMNPLDQKKNKGQGPRGSMGPMKSSTGGGASMKGSSGGAGAMGSSNGSIGGGSLGGGMGIGIAGAGGGSYRTQSK